MLPRWASHASDAATGAISGDLIFITAGPTADGQTLTQLTDAVATGVSAGGRAFTDENEPFEAQVGFVGVQVPN